MSTIRVVRTMTPEQWADHARNRTGPFRQSRTAGAERPNFRAMSAVATAVLLDIPVGYVAHTYTEDGGPDAA